MKLKQARAALIRLHRSAMPGSSRIWRSRSPIRGEIFSVERLEDHARSLAGELVVGQGRRGEGALARRLAENEAVLIAVCGEVSAAIRADSAITPPAEWLIDNFHIVERQIRDVRVDLPPGYYRQLPKLAGGDLAGYPRVLALAWEYVAHTDSLFDPVGLRRYLRAFQEVQSLTIGELWAVAITLRLVLVENLRRIALRVQGSAAAREAADETADRILGANGVPRQSAESVLKALQSETRTEAFYVQLIHRLRDQDASVAPVLEWLDDHLGQAGSSPEQMVREEHQRQVSGSVSVKNIITSMRLISNVDWTELFESASLVDDLLESRSAFRKNDFPTRNLYRTAIETLARGSGLDELVVADAALTAAERAARDDPGDSRRSDPGYALIGGGRRAFEKALGFRIPTWSLPGRIYSALGIGGYISGVGIGTALILAIAMGLSGVHGTIGLWLTLAGVIPAVDLAVVLVNHLITRGYRAGLLPALDLDGVVPESLRTLVVTPTFLTTPQDIADQVQKLEVHFLASPTGELYFALLTDWRDSSEAATAADWDLLTAAHLAVDELNAKHGPGPAGPRFYLLHRRRIWSASEGRWIGWERKRGKLDELNRLLRGAGDTSFLTPNATPPDVRFVITLDADTRLPRETVSRLVGKMGHPLNRPRLDPALQRVVEGYGILQPRVTPSLPVGREGSVFLRVFSGAIGIDVYAAAVSDVYQDLFGEGSYTGKGIYDVDAFTAALAGRVPTNTMLSHDLFEGGYARAGLASDVEVVEDFPVRYDVACQRHHRWARGDWQLLPWMFTLSPPGGQRGPAGRLPGLTRWKMLDNLRRSLSAPAMFVGLVLGWTLPLPQAAAWTTFILLTVLLPPLTPVLISVFDRRSGATLHSHWRALKNEFGLAGMQAGLMIVFLAHQAWLMSDAIVRTLVRMNLTHQHMLEWTPSALVSEKAGLNLAANYRQMGGALVLALIAMAALLLSGGNAWPIAAPLILAWLLSPACAYLAGQSPRIAGRRPLGPEDAQFLRLIARSTWRYFEQFVTARDNMLPPDNFQETPVPILARRTSPTNIGLYLLSVASARDFGWIGLTGAIERLEATLATVGRMETFRGHLYNWYDTADLRPLEPKYVSSVDSGNFAGHLIALANACDEWAVEGRSHRTPVQGVWDSVLALKAEVASQGRALGAAELLWRRLDILIQAFETLLEDEEQTLASLLVQALILADAVHEVAFDGGLGWDSDLQVWALSIVQTLQSHQQDLQDNHSGARLEALSLKLRDLATDMQFAFLLDPDRMLLSIGFSVDEGLLDPSCYDLLASEARLASFFAIAKRDVPTRHWFRLGRSVTPTGEGAALVSWSGSMFEYLMPSIVMAAPSDSLIEQTNRLIVARQVAFGRENNMPWGVSESAYNARDLDMTYQYSNFGLPGLGLKRGLGENRVVAPYATGLASLIDPNSAVENYHHLEGLGARGAYGFYEALDFTPARLPTGKTFAVIMAFMAHHQGMTITAIADTLMDGILRRRFHAEPAVKAAALLLQERVPRDVTEIAEPTSEIRSSPRLTDIESPYATRIDPAGPTPVTQVLSNGAYTVMLTAAGSGFSRWKGFAISRWREDATSDDWGGYIYLRDPTTGDVASVTHQPFDGAGTAGEVRFDEDHARFSRTILGLTCTQQVVVSAEDNAEVRRVTLTNNDDHPRVVEITSYVELALAPQAADQAHPAFSKMFVETAYSPSLGVLTGTRRRRDPDEAEIWAGHLVVVDGEVVGSREFETDRAQFLGRSGSVRSPRSVLSGRPLSGTLGIVLDPIFALRRRIRLEPGATARVDFWTLAASTRQDILNLADKHQDVGAFERASSLAWTQAQVQLHHLGIERGAARQFQRLAGHMIYASPAMRPASRILEAGMGSQSDLWSFGVSGDLPILLVRVSESDHLALVKEALQAFEYWRMKTLAVDLVILNERDSSYAQDFQEAVEALVRASQSRPQVGPEQAPGHVFILRGDQIAPAARALLISVARVVLVGDRGRLSDQMDRAPEVGRITPVRPRGSGPASELQINRPPPNVEYFNGVGGFVDDGREYLVVLGPGQTTPAPWVNIIANLDFGFQVSAEGSGAAWSINSRERQITPWSNDPVTDRPGQAFYIRDLDTTDLWSPTASPIRDDAATYLARHGWGYSQFEHVTREISTVLTEFVPLKDPLKISRLVLRNLSSHTRRLSVTGYVEWVLGQSRSAMAPFTETRLDGATGALLATNAWTKDFAQRVAFADLLGRQTSWTGDRREFLGRNGGPEWPAALLDNRPLSGRTGAGLDPCGALQTTLTLAPGETREVVMILGDGADLEAARALVKRYRTTDLDGVLAGVKGFWRDTVGQVQVKTPDRSMDIMLNGWLTYQTLSSRVWARAGFYQASGAYGFRDQLQDGMALATVLPGETREHLLRAAGRQFIEGDVQHWWLPHSGQGVRTHFSDDRIWLAYASAHYAKVTGDTGVLDDLVGYLTGPILDPAKADEFFTPGANPGRQTLYSHCAKALDTSLTLGDHGAPLFGGGDWNDGMNLVGKAGRGESVWLGWFLHAALESFIPIARARGETERADRWRDHMSKLSQDLESKAWDGQWFLRGWFDDGAPLGSAANDECRIDSIAQSWAVLSDGTSLDRGKTAMASVDRELIRPQEGLALLFSPPFERTQHDPGYIKGYPPGLRENGGQYTHAAAWSVMAFAKLGDGEKAAALFWMLNPINHARTRMDMHRYKVEPYVVAADIYSAQGHSGRGGWTWYTGAAGWLQRAGLESILGLTIESNRLLLDPAIPPDWAGFQITRRFGKSTYHIDVKQVLGAKKGIQSVRLDGQALAVGPVSIGLVDDGADHSLSLVLESGRGM